MIWIIYHQNSDRCHNPIIKKYMVCTCYCNQEKSEKRVKIIDKSKEFGDGGYDKKDEATETSEALISFLQNKHLYEVFPHASFAINFIYHKRWK